MAFGIPRKSASKHLGNNKSRQNNLGRCPIYFRPAVEYLEDRRLPSTVVPISLANGGPSVTPNGDSGFLGSVSADGRYVAFSSQATNIVPGQQDANGTYDVFLYDRLTQTTTLVSHASDSTTTTANGRSLCDNTSSISADGRFVVFQSTATNLVAGQVDTNNAFDIFLYDRSTGTNVLVSHTSGSLTTTGDQGEISPSISADGNFVVFGEGNLFLYERQTGSITLVSHSFSSPTTPANGPSDHPKINADGRRIAFESFATDLINGQVGGQFGNMFLYDRLTGTNTLASHAFGSTTISGDMNSQTTAAQGISADGNFVAYLSGASNLVSGQVNNSIGNVFLYDASTGTNTLVSHSSSGSSTTANASSFFPAISSDGSSIAFSTRATDLVNGQQDANNTDDAFLYDRSTGQIALVSHIPGSATTTANGSSENASWSFSADGNILVYGSAATNLVTGQNDTNGQSDVFLYDKATGLNTLISHISASATTTGNNDSGPGGISSDGRFVIFASDATDLVAGDLNNHQDLFGSEPFDAPLTASGTFVSSASEEIAFTAIVAHFTDADPRTTSEYFKATINWGDGNISAGTVSANGNGGFDVTGSHIYAAEGPYPVLVQIADIGGSTASANSVVHVVEGPSSDINGRASQTGQIWTGVSTGSSFSSSMWGTLDPTVTWVDPIVGDFNGDGRTDIAARNLNTGAWWVGLSNGSAFTMSVWTTWSTRVIWADVQVGDFNGDGKADIVGRAQQTGQWWVAQSTGSSFTNSLWDTWSTMATWVDVKVGDFNGDGKADITGRWLEGGSWWTGVSTGSSFTTSMWAAWSTAVTWVDVQVGDFNGDGKADITGRALETGQWWTGLSTGSSFSTSLWTTWSTGVTWVDVKVGDFNGDGKDDIIGRALETGQWWAAISSASGFTNSLWSTWSTGVTWVNVQVGDFNGDGKSDITGRAFETGQWWTGLSNGSGFTNSLWATWSTSVTWTGVRTGDFA